MVAPVPNLHILILAAGASIAVVQWAGLSFVWLALVALGLALFARSLRWH